MKLYIKLSIAVISCYSFTVLAYDKFIKDLPDVEIHLENLPSVKKIEKKHPEKHHEHKAANTHKTTKTQHIKPEEKPIPVNPAPKSLVQDKEVPAKISPIAVISDPKLKNLVEVNLGIATLNYEKNEVALNPKNIEKLDLLCKTLKENSKKTISIVGYSSDSNTKDLEIIGNHALQRIVEVRKYLLSKGIDTSRIEMHSAANQTLIVAQDKVEITIKDSKK